MKTRDYAQNMFLDENWLDFLRFLAHLVLIEDMSAAFDMLFVLWF